jgi:hypothetical protein
MSVVYVSDAGNLHAYSHGNGKDETILSTGDISQVCIDGGGQTMWLLTDGGIKCVNLNTYGDNLSWKDNLAFPGGTIVKAKRIASGSNGEYSATSTCFYIAEDGSLGKLDSAGNNTAILKGYKAIDIAAPNVQPPVDVAHLPKTILPLSFVLESITETIQGQDQTTNYFQNGLYPIVWFDIKDTSTSPKLYGSPQETINTIMGTAVFGMDYETIGLLDQSGNFSQYKTTDVSKPSSTYDNNNFVCGGTNSNSPYSPVLVAYGEDNDVYTIMNITEYEGSQRYSYQTSVAVINALETTYGWYFFTGESNP